MVNSQAVGGSGCASRACAGCGGRISDRFLLFSMERYWHTRCLKCSCCQAQLGDIGTTCYSKGGMILCRSDYIRLFGHAGACSACGQSIPPSEMVMRAQGNVYHLKCFSCATCRNRLVPGDRFHYVNGTIFCEHDRPSAPLLGAHLQGNPVLPDQKVSLLKPSSPHPPRPPRPPRLPPHSVPPPLTDLRISLACTSPALTS
ncbi:LIM domain transcription factor LMO4.2 [Silurus asotus]|uniref:LIM domain transcription factor LMO4.2 n=1 Tax=Silurus asotus TaxID=30991 RepID=A0AAD5AUZ4_SILAS|nr:LIM domain transcription factor LMO4.2 [Silurus asotus]